MTSTPLAPLQGYHHVRLTVTDIERSKAFYAMVFGSEPAIDFSDQVDDPTISDDPQRFYGGCVFSFQDQLLGLRPVARVGDRFDSTRVGLDHVGLLVPAVSDLEAAAERLDAAGITNGGVSELSEIGMSILSFQDPDDINLELLALHA